mmetsp:Transcript_17307/g.48221  ORF Transcript_17307/g.48221 Transcript_17307/m.48221 type:complete len:91 (-) Transcript_17307:620-892(-)
MPAAADSSDTSPKPGTKVGDASSSSTSQPSEVWAFKCAQEASALLNCVANGGKKKSYNEVKCQTLLKALRVCCEKEGVVDFELTSGEARK